jgi:hypothetical protein
MIHIIRTRPSTPKKGVIKVTKLDINKDKRVNTEKQRLKKIYKDIPEDKKQLIDGLINRAAFMRITLEDMEIDLDTKGFVEEFSQSEKLAPYERERPVARLYNTMNKNYQSIIKQLADLTPKEVRKEVDDGFNDFVQYRE